MGTSAGVLPSKRSELSSDRYHSSQLSLVRLLAFFGALCAGWMIYLFVAWMTSAQFRPVNPGSDVLPAKDHLLLLGLQIGGLLLTIYFLYSYVLRPKLATGRFSTDGLVVLGLGFLWWTDPIFNYTQNWLVYNAYLWNMGSWAGPIFPSWVAPHSENFPEPFVVGIGQIFWLFLGALFGAWLMKWVRNRWGLGTLSTWLVGFVGCLLFVLSAETGAVFIGWYVMPGATRAMSLFPGTQYQISMVEVFFGAWQTLGVASLVYVRDDRGYTWADRDAHGLTSGKRTQTFVRYLAIIGALNLVSLAGYFIPIQFQGLHTDPWPEGLPSYFTMTCPEYRVHPERCGGPGVSIPRADNPK